MAGEAGLTDAEIGYLERCVALAEEAVAAGDGPFGSVLVDAAGRVLAEDRNRNRSRNATYHPEFELARWAGDHLDAAGRAAATVYTSTEHCPMCAAATAWVGIGRVVFASSSARLGEWLGAVDAEPLPVAPLPISTIAPGITAIGPVPAFADRLRALHQAAERRDQARDARE